MSIPYLPPDHFLKVAGKQVSLSPRHFHQLELRAAHRGGGRRRSQRLRSVHTDLQGRRRVRSGSPANVSGVIVVGKSGSDVENDVQRTSSKILPASKPHRVKAQPHLRPLRIKNHPDLWRQGFEAQWYHLHQQQTVCRRSGQVFLQNGLTQQQQLKVLLRLSPFQRWPRDGLEAERIFWRVGYPSSG